MKYRILVLDIDGTLTNNKKEITDNTLKALHTLQSKGVKLVLASGRPTYGIVPLAKQLKMEEYGGFILSYNGGQIIDCSNDKLVYSNVLPNEIVPLLDRCAKQNDVAILSYKADCIITEHPDDEFVAKEAFLNKMAIQGCDDFLSSVELPLPKCLMVGEPNKMIEVESIVKKLVDDKINVFRSEPYFLELVPKGIDKALSLSKLLAHLGMQREEMIAVGDGFNDLSMIEFAGLGVAMGNAQDEVKKVADFVTTSNEEDGVVAVIERYLS